MSDAKLNLIFAAKNLAGEAVTKLEGQLSGLGKTGKGLAGLASTGFGLGAGLGIFGLATGGISGVASAMGDSVTAYRNAEEAQARLNTSLRENVAGWDGSTAATDRAMHASEHLGFTNTETMDSLALLVGATHDVTKATDMLSVAQDYARFKNVDLMQAATDLTKVEGGSTRALKALGINLATGSTEAERMAAIMKVVGGQAQAFATTDLGKVAAADEVVNESMVKLGKTFSQIGAVILPAMADALEHAVDRSSISIGDMQYAAEHGSQAAQAALRHIADEDAHAAQVAGTAVDEMDGHVRHLGTSFQETTAAVVRNADELNDHLADIDVHLRRVGPAAEDADGHTRHLNTSFENVGYAAKTMRDYVSEAMSATAKAAEDNESRTTAAMKGLIDQGYAPAIAEAQIAATQREIADQDAIISSKKSTDAEIADAKLRRLQLKQTLDEQLVDQQTYGSTAERMAYLNGQLQSAKLAAGLSSKIESVRAAAQAEKDAITAELKLLSTLAYDYGRATSAELAAGIRSGAPLVNSATGFVVGEVNANLVTKSPSKKGPWATMWPEKIGQIAAQNFAKGLRGGAESVDAAAAAFAQGVPFGGSPGNSAFGLAGGNGGYVMPSAGGGGRGGGVTVHFNSTWPPSPEQAREVARAVDREMHYGLAGARSTMRS